MRVVLLRDSRINHKKGEIVEVSPEQGAFLLSVGSARVETATIKVKEVAEKAEEAPKATKTTVKKTKK